MNCRKEREGEDREAVAGKHILVKQFVIKIHIMQLLKGNTEEHPVYSL